MLEKFKDHRFQKKTRERLERIKVIIAEYEARGFKLGCRQIHYQFVARGWHENTENNVGKINSTLRNAREAGEVDWDMIEDRSRQLIEPVTYDGPADRIEYASYSYAEEPWKDQRYRPIVCIEKHGLLESITGVCDEHGVLYFAHHGSCSRTILYKVAKRCAEISDQGQTPLVLHLSDHDPTGKQMDHSVSNSISKYANRKIEMRRLGLTKQQVRQYRLIPFPAKETDPRYNEYVEEHGVSAWELDALEPEAISGLIRTELNKLIDRKKWKAAKRQEERNRAQIKWVADNWTKVEKLYGKGKWLE
jgi:hypothetical protein